MPRPQRTVPQRTVPPDEDAPYEPPESRSTGPAPQGSAPTGGAPTGRAPQSRRPASRYTSNKRNPRDSPKGFFRKPRDNGDGDYTYLTDAGVARVEQENTYNHELAPDELLRKLVWAGTLKSPAVLMTGKDNRYPYILRATNSDLEAGFDDFANRVVNGGQNPYFPTREKLDNAIRQSLGVDELTPEHQQEFMKRSNELDTFAHTYRGQVASASASGWSSLSRDLVSNDVNARQAAMSFLDLQAEDIGRVYGPDAANSIKLQVAAKLSSGDRAQMEEGLHMLGMAQEQAAQVLGSVDGTGARGIAPEANTAARAGMPYLKNLPVWAHATGMAAAGAGATAVAAHLISQGQQQASSADYANAVRALNAY